MGGRYGYEWVDGRSARPGRNGFVYMYGGSIMGRRGSTWVDVGRRWVDVGRKGVEQVRTGCAQGPQGEGRRYESTPGRRGSSMSRADPLSTHFLLYPLPGPSHFDPLRPTTPTYLVSVSHRD
eukprot:2776192-Prymnesium_polylepis.1